MRRFARLSALALLAIGMTGLSGCSWLRGKDNSEPPAELTDIQASVKLEELWSRDAGAGSDEQFLRLRPAVDDGRVFAADHKGRVTAYDARSGQEIWSVKTDIAISSGVGTGEGLILVGSSEAEVVALDWRDGHEVWRSKVSSEVLSVPGADQGTVVVQSVDGKLTALKSSDGTRLWTFERSVPAAFALARSICTVSPGLTSLLKLICSHCACQAACSSIVKQSAIHSM